MVDRDELVEILPRLKRYATALTRNKSNADDLVQHTCYCALRREESFQTGTNLTAWCMTIMRNEFINDRKRGSTRYEVTSIDDVPHHIGSKSRQDGRDALADAERLLARLKDHHYNVIIGVGLEGQTIQEFAEANGLDTGTVRSRLSRARAILAAMAADSGPV